VRSFNTPAKERFARPGALPQPPSGAARRSGTRPARWTWHGLGRGAKEGVCARFCAPACCAQEAFTQKAALFPWRPLLPPRRLRWQPRA
jgi:hypothetical protein